MLERHQLSFEEENSLSSQGQSPVGTVKKGLPVLVCPKDEKGDSVVTGSDENVKVLDDKKLKLPSSLPDVETGKVGSKTGEADGSDSGSKCVEPEDDDVETEEEVIGGCGDAGDSTENEDDATGKLTCIDDDLSDKEKDADTTPPSTRTSFSLSAPSTILKSALISKKPLPLGMPTSDSSLLVKSTDHTHPSTFPRHVAAISSSGSSSGQTAPKLCQHGGKRMNPLVEDLSKLSLLSKDLDITVSPPTPGVCVCVCNHGSKPWHCSFILLSPFVCFISSSSFSLFSLPPPPSLPPPSSSSSSPLCLPPSSLLVASATVFFHDSSSSSGIMDYSPVSSPRHSLVASPITIKRGKKGYGLTFISIRVYIGDSNDYRIHHIIEVCKY